MDTFFALPLLLLKLTPTVGQRVVNLKLENSSAFSVPHFISTTGRGVASIIVHFMSSQCIIYVNEIFSVHFIQIVFTLVLYEYQRLEFGKTKDHLFSFTGRIFNNSRPC